MIEIRKVGIVGIGNVGATIAYTLMESKMFKREVGENIRSKRGRKE